MPERSRNAGPKDPQAWSETSGHKAAGTALAITAVTIVGQQRPWKLPRTFSHVDLMRKELFCSFLIRMSMESVGFLTSVMKGGTPSAVACNRASCPEAVELRVSDVLIEEFPKREGLMG